MALQMVLVADLLAQTLAHGPGTSGFCGKALGVSEDRAREFGLRGQGAADAKRQRKAPGRPPRRAW